MSFIPLFINSYDNSFIWELIQIPIIHQIIHSRCVNFSLLVSYEALEATSTLPGYQLE